MSRLDSFIRRVTAQRDCLNHAAELVEGKQGTILELGLGNGRTYDHLRKLFDAGDIFVFDRHVKAHPDCIPDDDHMIVGDFVETLQQVHAKLPYKAKVAHCDIGSGDKAASVSMAEKLAEFLPDLLQEGAIIVSDQPFTVAAWTALPLPAGIAEGRYYIYKQD